MKKIKQENVWQLKNKFATPSLTPGIKFFDNEDVIIINNEEFENKEFRIVDPNHSKFFAGLAKGLQQTGLKEGSTVLYLGASHGYTPSFFSDIIKNKGMIFCLDVAPRVVRDLWFVCKVRNNMAPIFDDANHPENYKDLIPEEGVDVIFQDVAQRNQVEIFLKNCDAYLKNEGYGMLALKARSVDVTKKPQEIFKKIKKDFDSNKNYTLIDYRELYPFEKDHAFFVIKKRHIHKNN